MTKSTLPDLMNEFERPLPPPSSSAFMADYEESNPQSGSGLSLHHLLFRALHSRDELLWTEFIRRSQPVIVGVVTKTMRQWAQLTSGLVDDLVQETYLRLFANNARALRSFVCRHETALYGFLKVVASNVVQDHFRSACSQKRGSERWAESIEHDGSISRIGEANGPWAIVREARQLGRVVATSVGVRNALEGHILLCQIDTSLKSQLSGPTFSRDYSIFWLYYRDGLSAKAISRMPSIRLGVKGVESLLLRLTRSVRVNMARQCFQPTKMAKNNIGSPLKK